MVLVQPAFDQSLAPDIPCNAIPVKPWPWSSLSVEVPEKSRFNNSIICALRVVLTARPVTISKSRRAVASVVSLFRFSPFGPRETFSRP